MYPALLPPQRRRCCGNEGDIPHTDASYLVGGGVLGPLSVQIKDLKIPLFLLLLLLLLLYYPFAPPPLPMMILPCLSLSGIEGEGRVQQVQYGGGLPSRMCSRNDVALRDPPPPADKVGGSDGVTVAVVIVVDTPSSPWNSYSNSSSYS